MLHHIPPGHRPAATGLISFEYFSVYATVKDELNDCPVAKELIAVLTELGTEAYYEFFKKTFQMAVPRKLSSMPVVLEDVTMKFVRIWLDEGTAMIYRLKTNNSFIKWDNDGATADS